MKGKRKVRTKEDYFNFMREHGSNPINWGSYTNALFQREFAESNEEIKQWHKELNNLLSKRYRIREKIKKFKEIYWIRLSIAPKYENNKKETFERKIKEIFKNTNYIANEDYGQDPKYTQRLHYHVIAENDIDLSKWIYGYTTKFKARTNDIDIKRLSSYQTKLANHCIKKGTGKIIYGRAKKQKNMENTKN